MFDWFWKFLYSISKFFMWICDQLLYVSKVLIGIDPIKYNGEDIDLITYLITSDRVRFAFAGCVLIAMTLLTGFTIIQILRTIAKMGDGMTPGQIAMKSFKTFMIFLFVPFVMVTLIAFMNVFMESIFNAVMGGQSSIGTFMFICFADAGDAWHSGCDGDGFLAAGADYNSTGQVKNWIDISDFAFIYSWIVGFVAMYNIAAAMIMFVDRAISIVILFVLSPFPIAAAVIDDGARFKSWREQVLNKFLVGFGVLLAIAFYILVSSLVCNTHVQLIPGNTALSNIAKILFILGGATTCKKAGALVGSMVSASGGNEAMDPAFQGNKLFSALGSAISAPFKAARGITNFATEAKVKGLGTATAHAFGFKVKDDFKNGGGGGSGSGSEGSGEGSGSTNNNNPKYNDKQGLNEALNGGNQKEDDKKDDNNQNNNTPNQGKGQGMLNSALNNDDGNKKNNEGDEE
ncbi:MAG: hypothetical protein MJ068_02270 [Clostridia bacterium]|nr:hypothetical protein [Clostridia bacterium]